MKDQTVDQPGPAKRRNRFLGLLLLVVIGASVLAWLTAIQARMYRKAQASQSQVSRSPVFPSAGKAGVFSGEIVLAECRKLDYPAPLDHYRFFRYVTDYSYGEALPSQTVVTGSARFATRSYLKRSVETQEAPHRSWRFFVLFLYVPLFGLAAILLLGFVGLCFRPSSGGFCAGVVVVVVCGLLVLFLGYVSGSEFVVDNATDTGVQVRINGSAAATLPAHRFYPTRISSGDVKVEVLENGRLLESARLELDGSTWNGFVRALVGRGAFLYNIAAANAYERTAAGYMASR